LQGEDLQSLSDIDDLASTFSKVRLLDIDNDCAVTEECNCLLFKFVGKFIECCLFIWER